MVVLLINFDCSIHASRSTVVLVKWSSLLASGYIQWLRQDWHQSVPKPTHTYRYLPYTSHHSQHVKKGVDSCLIELCRNSGYRINIGKEVKHVTEVLKANGYPVHLSRMAKKHRKREQEEEKPKYRICLPYVSGLSEDLRSISQKVWHQDHVHHSLHTQITTYHG